MYFLTYEYIKRKVVESAPEGTKASRSREIGGTVFAGGMGMNQDGIAGLYIIIIINLNSWYC